MEQPVHRGFGAGTRHLPRDRSGHRLTGQREGHIADSRDATRDSSKRAGPEVVDPHRLLLANRSGQRRGHQVHVSIYAAGDYEQAMGVELVLPRHGTAELDYPAIPNPDVADFAMARSDN